MKQNPKHLLLLVMLFVAGSAMAQSVEIRTYEVGKFLMEHGRFYLYPCKAISKKKGLEQKYAMSCSGIGEKISSQEAVGADGNLWELEDAGDGYYYIKNNKGCYLPECSGITSSVGKGKGKALKAKLVRNVQGKYKGILIQDKNQYLNNLYGRNTDYSCLGSENDSHLSDPNFTFHFVTLDGKTIDDVSENVSYHFKYDTTKDWKLPGFYGETSSNGKPFSTFEYKSPLEIVDVALDTRMIGGLIWHYAESGLTPSKLYFDGIASIVIQKCADRTIDQAEELGIEVTSDYKKAVRDSVLRQAKDYALTKLPNFMEKDSASVQAFLAWILKSSDDKYDSRNNRWIWPTIKAMTKVLKPVDGCYVISEDMMLRGEEPDHYDFVHEKRILWGDELVNLSDSHGEPIYGYRYLIYSANEDKVYLGDFYHFGTEGEVYEISRSSKERVLPFDKSGFVGLELSEKAFLGLEEPVHHYLGKNSLEEANAYVAQIQRKRADKIQAENAKYEAKRERQREANIKAHYARLTKKYGQKAVNAMLNDRPYVGMPAGILREGIKTDGVFVLSSGWEITSSFGGRTVYSKGRRRCLAVNGVVHSVYRE